MNNKELTKIIKGYKNTDLLFEIFLENYHSFNIYIRLDYYKKQKVYRLSWVDLAHIKQNPLDVVSYEYLPDNVINDLENIIKNIKITKYEKLTSSEHKVTINNHLATNNFSVVFNRYLPGDLGPLYTVLNIIFDNINEKEF